MEQINNLFAPLLGRIDALSRQIENLEKRVNEISPEKNDLMTIEGCASLLDLKRSTVYRMTSEGRIPHFKRGGRVYFSRQEVLNWLKNSENRKGVEL